MIAGDAEPPSGGPIERSAHSHGRELIAIGAGTVLLLCAAMEDRFDAAIAPQPAREPALVQLNKLREGVGRDAALVDVRAECGDPTNSILEQAHTGKFDLIVIGTHGRTGLRRVLMGSVAMGVVRRAQIPVVTIHVPRDSLGE